MLKFLVDTHLPPSLCGLLKKAGFDAVHTTDFVESQRMNDKQIRQIAVEQNRLIVTKDADFFEHFIVKGSPPRVLLLEIGNVPNTKLFDIFRHNISSLSDLFKDGASLIIVHSDKLVAY